MIFAPQSLQASVQGPTLDSCGVSKRQQNRSTTRTSQTPQQSLPRPRGDARRPGTATPLNAPANRLAARTGRNGRGRARGAGARAGRSHLGVAHACAVEPYSHSAELLSSARAFACPQPETSSKASKTVEATAELRSPDKYFHIIFSVFLKELS